MKQMLQMIALRLAGGLGVLFVVSLIVFGALEVMPGDLAEEILGQSATPETVAALRAELGLDRPAGERYVEWISDMARGDFGRSLANDRPILELISERLDNTLILAVVSACISVPLALGLGILAALYRNSIFDRVVNIFALGSTSVPEFLIAYFLIVIFSVQFSLLPALSNVSPSMEFAERLKLTLLPALTLTFAVLAHMMRMTRAAIINLLSRPYVEMAHLKGMSAARVILVHALPNALAPIINVVILNLAYLIVGVVVVEVVFVYPGLGQLLVDSVSKRDMPVVQAACLIFAVTYTLLNLLADILSTLVDPRHRGEVDQ